MTGGQREPEWRKHCAECAELATQKLTKEERDRWADMFHATWQAIGEDCSQLEGRLTKSVIVELVCDANRVQMYGGMTDEEYDFLCTVYERPTFQRWARKELNYA